MPTSLVGRLKLDPFDMHNLPIVSLIFSRLTTASAKSVVSEVLLCPVVYLARSISIFVSRLRDRFEDRHLNYKLEHTVAAIKANISMRAARFTSGWKGAINRYYLGASCSIILLLSRAASRASDAFIRYLACPLDECRYVHIVTR
jgi:cation transport ATPase